MLVVAIRQVQHTFDIAEAQSMAAGEALAGDYEGVREAYERLIDDALAGLPRRFARQDIVEQTWSIVQPALDNPGPVHPYFRGSWGPAEADKILGGDAWLPVSS